MKESFADYLEKLVCEYIEYSKNDNLENEKEIKNEVPEIENSIDDAKEILKKAEDLSSAVSDEKTTSLASIVPLPDDWAKEVQQTEQEKKPRKKSSKNFVNIPRN